MAIDVLLWLLLTFGGTWTVEGPKGKALEISMTERGEVTLVEVTAEETEA